jgi:hypothetical protein
MVHFEVYARGNRHEATQRVADALAAAGGWILDSHFFSGVVLNLFFEVDSSNIARLESELERCGQLVTTKQERLPVEGASGLVQGTLRVCFVDGDPDLRRTVPSVPG